MERTVQTTFAAVFGLILILFGIVGFFAPALIGTLSNTPAHNLIHLAIGAAGVVCGVWIDARSSRIYNKVTGITLLLVALVGFFGILDTVTALGLTMQDHLLHTLLGALALGFGSSRN